MGSDDSTLSKPVKGKLYALRDPLNLMNIGAYPDPQSAWAADRATASEWAQNYRHLLLDLGSGPYLVIDTVGEYSLLLAGGMSGWVKFERFMIDMIEAV